MKTGHEVLAINGSGKSVYARLKFEKKRVILEYVHQGLCLPVDSIELTVELAILKGERMNWIISKLTELGVNYVIPLCTQHSVVKIQDHSVNDTQARWQKIADQALKQTKRLHRMKIAAPQTLQSYFQTQKAAGIKIFCNEQCRDQAPFLMNWLWNLSHTSEQWNILIGPEGGWSAAERILIEKENYQKISLGPFLLRAETAALFAVSLVSALIQKKHYETKAL